MKKASAEQQAHAMLRQQISKAGRPPTAPITSAQALVQAQPALFSVPAQSRQQPASARRAAPHPVVNNIANAIIFSVRPKAAPATRQDASALPLSVQSPAAARGREQ